MAIDKLVLPLSELRIVIMLNICKHQSAKWRYEFQAPKCIVVVINEAYDARPLEAMQYRHLGILLNKYI